ncbi:unnamed protein product [Effrenium voratum]|nr:unnamed protein product [Effrenium voratum]
MKGVRQDFVPDRLSRETARFSRPGPGAVSKCEKEPIGRSISLKVELVIELLFWLSSRHERRANCAVVRLCPMDKVSWSSLLEAYDMLWKMIIRPPRSQYKLSELGPPKFRIGSQVYTREDFQLKNDRGMLLVCSLYRTFPKQGGAPCVIYLHGNCSSRVEAMDVLQVVLAKNLMLCSLDLSGSGHSEGEFISLGHFEQLDLKVLIQFLRSSGVAQLGLWGRSMGAATSILRAAEDWSISAVVLDSPFSSLPLVAQELVNSQISIPEFMMNLALGRVRQEILDRANFDIQDLQPIRSASRARAPALFATAKDDDFILPHHTFDLHSAWGCERKLVTFEGGHNGLRPKWFLEEGADFLAKRLKDKLPAMPSPMLVSKPVVEVEDPVPPAPQPVPQPAKARGAPAPAPSVRSRPAPGEVASQLVAMGFSKEVAEEAAKQFASAEAAMEWTLQEDTTRSAALDSSLSKKLRPPERRRNTLDAESAVEAAAAAAGAAVWARLRQGSALGELCHRGLVPQLVELGFAADAASAAAARCSSVESAVAWLADSSH